MRVDAHELKAPPPPVTKGDVGDLHPRGAPGAAVHPRAGRAAGPPTSTCPSSSWARAPRATSSWSRVYADAFYRPVQAQRGDRGLRPEGDRGQDRASRRCKALHSAVMKRFPGRDVGLAQSAISTMAQDRGSRLMLMKAGLESLGMTTAHRGDSPLHLGSRALPVPRGLAAASYPALRVQVPGRGAVLGGHLDALRPVRPPAGDGAGRAHRVPAARARPALGEAEDAAAGGAARQEGAARRWS